MIAEPRFEERGEQPYAAIRVQVPIPFGEVLPGLWSDVYGFLSRQGLKPSGPPFIRYLTTDMNTRLDIEVGFPLAAPVAGDGRVTTGHLPAGRYVVLLYTGPYDALVAVTGELLDWAEANRVIWKTEHVDGGEQWAGRVEWYPTDPAEEPDPGKWQTELAFLTA